MDRSLSTLAPIFAVVLATHHPLTAFFTGAAFHRRSRGGYDPPALLTALAAKAAENR